MKSIDSLRLRLAEGWASLWARGREFWDAEVLPRYQQLAPRERRLVLAAAILLPLAVLLFGVILPIQDKQRALRDDLRMLRGQAAEAERLAALIRKQGASGQSEHGVNALAVVERLARQFHLRQSMTRIRPQLVPEGRKQRLMLQMKNAPYAQVIRFAEALAKEHLGLISIKIQQGESPGMVHVRAVIEGG